MPELPEVETSRRGIAPFVEQQKVSTVIVRDRRLRWPVPAEIDRDLPGQEIKSVRRRAKYLLFDTDAGTATWRRSAYDISEVQAAMTRLSLPERLVARLAYGL